MTVNAYTVCNGDFTEKIDVVGPKCGQRATVVGARLDALVTHYEEHVRFSCAACGYAVKYGNTPKFNAYVNSRGKAERGRMLMLNGPCDQFFGFSVWYLIATIHGTIWAYKLAKHKVMEQQNAKHQNQ